MKTFHLHLVSDSTGETLNLVSKACLVQFDSIQAMEHVWSMVRGKNMIDEVIKGVECYRGLVLYTLVDTDMRKALEDGCRKLKVPCIPILDPVIAALGNYLGAEIHAKPGRQHIMDAGYFSRIEAMHFVLSHDDGQSTETLDQADVVIVGVSRSSKTPTCIYLANRGIKAANVPFIPGCPLPLDSLDGKSPLIIGLVNDPKRLVQIRRNRLRLLKQNEETDYIDIDTVSREVNEARRMFTKKGWPIIDVSRKSIEEIAATILQHHARHVDARQSGS